MNTILKALQAPLQRRTVAKINEELNIKFNKCLHSKIPLSEIFTLLEEKYSVYVVQEDGTLWSGFLCGRESRTSIDLVYNKNPVKNFCLRLSWYQYETGRYEINTYIS